MDIATLPESSDESSSQNDVRHFPKRIPFSVSIPYRTFGFAWANVVDRPQPGFHGATRSFACVPKALSVFIE
jgi:hypothetical protein